MPARNGATDAEPESPGHLGHRARLRQRFKQAGPGALADYELLELLLFGPIPRRDTKPVAKALIAAFGSFGRVLHADPAALAEIDGMGEAAAGALKAVAAACERLLRERIADRPVLSSWNAVLDYCRVAMAHAKIEQLRLLFLDRKNALIADEVQQSGTVDHTPAYPREIVKRALELGASALILVHNHPSGDPAPSRADIEMTRDVARAAAPLGVEIHDHVIIGSGGRHASLKSLGLF